MVRLVLGCRWICLRHQSSRDWWSVCDLIPVIEDSPGTASHAVRGPGYHARQGWFGRTVTTNETGFAIERASYNPKGKLGSWSQIATVGAGVTSFDNTNLNKSTYYDYRIRAYNSAGYSAYAYATQSKVLAGMTAGGHNLAGADYTADGLDVLPLAPSGSGAASADATLTPPVTHPDLPALDELAAGLSLEASKHTAASSRATADRPWT
jgi:hypothetical protein